MKKLITGVLFLAFSVGVCVLSYCSVKSETQKLDSQLDSVIFYCEKDDTESAIIQAENCLSQFEKNRHIFRLYLPQKNAEKVEDCFEDFSIILRNEPQSLSLGAELLKNALKDAVNTQLPSPDTLF